MAKNYAQLGSELMFYLHNYGIYSITLPSPIVHLIRTFRECAADCYISEDTAGAEQCLRQVVLELADAVLKMDFTEYRYKSDIDQIVARIQEGENQL